MYVYGRNVIKDYKNLKKVYVLKVITITNVFTIKRFI